MIEINTIKGMNEWTKSKKSEKLSVGFVPTMGFLHEGHLSLIERAKQETDLVVMSVFVNPLQFGEGEDFDDYPRDKQRDASLAEAHGVDVLFYPDVEEMYPTPLSVTLKVHQGVDVLCGGSRPGHFDGVATIVMKLLQIIEPEKAFFGMKDAQQVSVIKRMVTDFNLKIEIVAVEIVRDEDGLAKSSRNVNLSSSERAEATKIYQTLKQVKHKALDKHTSDIPGLERWTKNQLKSQLIEGEIDYVQILNFPELTMPTDYEGEMILAVAVYYERARLIDNITWHQRG
ncbi:pantoate--beta-alanine ligase [Salipaludibacillus sp. HK11]|uniref:pantoate--beta-alanine ligase n=1 Tax=Salipaludibacillus sp. HK11 TaxID=3394320 RepID=UPI0039FBD907